MNKNHYTYSIALWFVTTLYQQRQGMIGSLGRSQWRALVFGLCGGGRPDGSRELSEARPD